MTVPIYYAHALQAHALHEASARTAAPCRTSLASAFLRTLLVFAAFIFAVGAEHAFAQITRIGASSASTGGGGGTSLAVATPAGSIANDVMVGMVSVRGSGQVINTPPGWTLASGPNSAASDYSQAMFYRVVTAGEPASHTFTWSVSDRGAAAIVTYRGVDTTSPINAVAAPAIFASTSTITTNSFNTTTVNTMLVGVFGIGHNGASFVGPGTMTNIFGPGSEPSSGAGPNGTRALVADELRGPTGATGTRSTITSQTNMAIGQMIALRPGRTFFIEAASGGAIGTQIAGTSFAIRITARNLSGITDTSFNGTVTITSTGNLSVGGGVTANFVNGVLVSHTVRISNTGTFTITATETGSTGTGVSNSFLVVPKLQILVPGETANPGTPSGKLGTPLTQTQGIAFNVTVNAVDEFWNLVPTATDTVNITSSDLAAVLPPAGALSGGTRTFSVILNTPPSATVTANAASPVRTDTSPPIPIALPGGRFNACDVGTACTDTTPATFIKTKVAGTNFNLDLVALKLDGSIDTSYNAVVRVELVDASDNSGALDADFCRPTWTTIATLSPDPAFTPANNGRITVGPFNIVNAYRDVRVRVTRITGPLRRGCSTDNFAIRPASFASFNASDNDWQTAGTGRVLNSVTFGAITHKAGQPFSVRANAVNSAGGVTTNYAGTPNANVSACVGAACTASFGTLTLNTAFASGQLITDVASYSEVGSFRLRLIDDSFAAVDNADGSTVAERRIQSALVNVGRFVPDHFAVSLNTPSFTTACGAGNFTYLGQSFGYGTQPVITVVARNAANNTTALYEGAWWRITNASLTGRSYTVATGTLDTSGSPGTDPAIAATGMGTGTLTFSSGTGFFFSRSTPVAPFDAEISLAINVIDADGVAYATNPARFGTATPGNGIAFSAGKAMRFGRLRIGNANGSNLVPLSVPVEVQHWVDAAGGGYFITNTADSCTALAGANIEMSNFTGSLGPVGACKTSVSNPITFSGGKGQLVLSAPSGGATGSVDLTVHLEQAVAGAPQTCVGGASTAVTGANRPWLRGNWTGGGYDQNPVGRGAFGAYRGGREVIYLREIF